MEPAADQRQIDELTRENKAASDFIRGCIEAIGIKQPHEGFEISLEALLLRVVGQIESLKGEIVQPVEPKSTQLPDSRGDAALWVLAWLAMKGGLGSDVHDVIEAVMEGRAQMRPNNKLHIEPRGAVKASCAELRDEV